MSTLIVSNGYKARRPGLGTIHPLLSLTEKRVTKAVREELRNRYGLQGVEVTCEANRSSNEWRGTCKIAGERFDYRVLPN